MNVLGYLLGPQPPPGDATTKHATMANLAALTGADVPDARLTLTSGTPVMTAPVSAATSVIYTPYVGNSVPVWNGSTFVNGTMVEYAQALSDTTKSPAAAVAGAVYDIFAWFDGTTFRATRGPSWASGATAGSTTARGTGAGSTTLVRTQGVLVNQYAITNGPAAGYGIYVGTVATDTSGATVSWTTGSSAAGGGKAIINVYNYYNRVKFCTNVRDSTTSHTYKSASFQAFDASTNNAVGFVRGVSEDQLIAQFCARVAAGTINASYAGIGIGLDSTTAISAMATEGYAILPGLSGAGESIQSTFCGDPGIGLHTLTALEIGDSSNANTFYGYPYSALTAEFIQ